MALVSNSIPNLLNGVSQQPAPLRQMTQGETQTNALSSVIDGLIKRPPTKHVAEILSTSTSDAAVHVVRINDDESHIIIARKEPTNTNANNVVLYIVKDDGTSTTLATLSPTEQSYLECANPAKDLKFLTIQDDTPSIAAIQYFGTKTLILNTTKTVAMDAALTSAPVSLSSTVYNDFSDLPDGYATGTTGGTGIATVGQIFEIAGSQSNNFDSYYVVCTGIGEGTTTYEETKRPNSLSDFTVNMQNSIDRETMPLELKGNVVVGNSNNAGQVNYFVGHATLGDRTVGDELSAPEPSFVGRPITNMFFYKNRLGFLSGENIIMSAAGDYFRFFPKTATTVLDDGPIDITVSAAKSSSLKQAVAFNNSLTIFSSNTQFKIENIGNLTPKTISIVPSTEFENDGSTAPVGAGNFLYFVSKKGNFSSVNEYYIEEDSILTDSLDVTAHVPKYLPKNIFKLATSSNENILIALSTETPNKLYVYKWFSDENQKLQSSWSTWELTSGATILDISIVESEAYLVVSYADGTVLEKIDLQYIDDSELNYCVRLDRKVELTGTYVQATDTTTWTLPYTYSGAMKAVRSSEWAAHRGADITVTRPTTTTVAASGDYSGSSFIIGIPYTMTYGFSPQYVKENNDTQSIQSGRLQMRTMQVAFENTGFFKIEVTPDHRQTYTYEYTGVTLNQAGSVIGEIVLNDGTFRFPLQSKNDRVKIEIKSESFLPCAFQSAEWEGFYNIRSKRI